MWRPAYDPPWTKAWTGFRHAAIERSYTFTCLTKTMAPIANKLRNAAMKYVGLEVSPQTSPTRPSGIQSRRPRHVRPTRFLYDRDGSLAGALVSALPHCRTNLDEVARIRAGSLGLREDRTAPHAHVAGFQKYLTDNPR